MKAKRFIACLLTLAMIATMFAVTSIPTVNAVVSSDDLLLDLDFSTYDGSATLTDKTGNLTVDMTGIDVGVGDGHNGGNSAKLTGSEQDAIQWTATDYNPLALTTTGTTVSMWIRVDSYKNWTHYFDCVSQSNTGFTMQYGDNSTTFINMTDEGAGSLSPGSGGQNYPGDGQWMLVTVSQKYGSKELDYYLNGQFTKAAAAKRSIKAMIAKGSGDSVIYSMGQHLSIWDGDASGDTSFGSLQIYGRALNAAEIAKLYDSSSDMSEPTYSSGKLLDLDFSDYNGEAQWTDETGNLTVDTSNVTVGTGRTDGTKSVSVTGDNDNSCIRWRGEQYDPYALTDTGVTISMWMRVDTKGTGDAHFWDFGRTSGFGFINQTNYTDVAYTHMQFSGGNNKTDFGGDGSYAGEGVWTLLTITQNYDTNTYTIYVNGVAKKFQTATYDLKDIATYGQYNSEYSLGKCGTLFEQWGYAKTDMSFASLQIYGRALTQNEITKLYDPSAEVVDPVCSSGKLLDLDFSNFNGESQWTDKTGNLTVDTSNVTVGSGRTENTKSISVLADNANSCIRWRGEQYDPYALTDTGVTVSMWMRVDTKGTGDAHFWDYGRVSGHGFINQLNYTSTTFAHMQYFGSNNKLEFGGDGAYSGEGVWAMLTMTQDYATNTFTIYINGVEKHVETGATYDLKDIATHGVYNSEYTLGKAGTIFDQWGSASTDMSFESLQIYGSAMSADDIYSLYSLDTAAIDNVISLIDAIGTVDATSTCLEKIVAAETAYAALSDSEKDYVTNYAVLTAARESYDTLMAAPADYTEVDAAISAAELLDENSYSEASWTALQNAINAVNRNLTVAQQTTVDAYATAINNAAAALVKKDVEMNVGISEGMVTEADTEGKYNITWNATITAGDRTSIDSINAADVTFKSYGVYYATGEETLQDYKNASADVIRQKVFANGEDIDVYTLFGFRLKNVNENATRAAMFYLEYEFNGTNYIILSSIDETIAIVA